MQRSFHLLPDDVSDAMRRGNKMEAIKLLRNATGLGLAEAKDAVEREALREYAAMSARSSSPMMSREVKAAIQQGSKLEAVRLLRDDTGWSLKEAYEAVNAAVDGHHTMATDLAPGEVPQSGSAMKWVVAVVFVAGLVIFFVFKSS